MFRTFSSGSTLRKVFRHNFIHFARNSSQLTLTDQPLNLVTPPLSLANQPLNPLNKPLTLATNPLILVKQPGFGTHGVTIANKQEPLPHTKSQQKTQTEPQLVKPPRA